MEITVLNRTNENLNLYSNLFEKISCSAEKLLKLDEDYEISVTFVRSRTIHGSLGVVKI